MTYFHILGFKMNIFSAIMMLYSGAISINALYLLLRSFYLVKFKNFTIDFSYKDKAFYAVIFVVILLQELLYWKYFYVHLTQGRVANAFYMPACYFIILGINMSLSIYKITSDSIYTFSKKLDRRSIKISYTDRKPAFLNKYHAKKIIFISSPKGVSHYIKLSDKGIEDFCNLLKTEEN